MRATDYSHPIREAMLLIESLVVCRAVFLKQIPLLRRLYRTVTADLRVLPAEGGVAMGFEIEFHSPYFRLPVSVDKNQIGQIKQGQWLEPGAFRLFDWQTWEHIDGNVEWHGEQCTLNKGQRLDLITGFSYRVPRLPPNVGNLGLRLAEGVEGNVRIVCERTIVQVSFEPLFWLLEATNGGFRSVPIKTNRLMGLIVSLFDIGSGNPRVSGAAITHLRQWAECNIGTSKPFTGTREFLTYIRDWGPLGMEPLYPGIRDVLKQLQVVDLERELFDFVADHWGIRSNRNARVLAMKLLGTLNTKPAKAALDAIYQFMRHGRVTGEELDLISTLADKVSDADGGASGIPH